MKTTKLKTTVFALATVLLTACGGDNNDPAPTPTPVPNQRVKSSSVKLTKSDGTTSTKNFTLTYNTENKLTNYQYLDGSPATVTDAVITYDNATKKASISAGKTLEYDIINGNLVKITNSTARANYETTLTYNSVGKVVEIIGKEFESGVENERRRVTCSLTYTGELLTKITRTNNNSSSPSTTDITYNTNGNISRTVYTSLNGRYVVTTNFTYDNRNEMGYNIANNSGWLVNNQGISFVPLFGTYNDSKLFNELTRVGLGYIGVYFYAKNNVLTKETVTKFNDAVESKWSYTYNYTYNSANYPLTVNETYTNERTGRPTRTTTYETAYTYEEY